MKKILLVNDCRFERMIMKDMLNNLGHDVYTSDEYNVLSKIKELSPNILICNLVMKETKGDLVIEKVKGIFPTISCFVSSSNDIKLEDYRSYVDGVIKTPTNPDQLSSTLSTIKIDKADDSRDLEGVSIKDSREEFFKRLAEKRSQTRNEDTKVNCNENMTAKNLKTLKYCPYCGESIEKFNNTIAFCPFCGGKLN